MQYKSLVFFFFFNDTATTEIYTLSLHDALPICLVEGFYISNNGPGAEQALLVAALVKAKGGPVKLLPAGEARLERVTDATLEDHGQKLHVTEFAIKIGRAHV